jgi:hypothetical protein
MNIIDELKSLLPIYTVVLPFSKMEVQFTPFKVKDLKNLTMVLHEDNKKLSFMAMIELLKNTTKLSIQQLNDLCLADAEYLFLHIRSKSVEETLNLVYKDKKVVINILDIKAKNKIQSGMVHVSDNIKIELKTPTVKKLLKLETFNKEDYIKACFKNIIVKNELYDSDKFVPDEIKNILEHLPIKIMNEFEKFTVSEPELYMEIPIDENNTIKEVSGILNFFIFR